MEENGKTEEVSEFEALRLRVEKGEKLSDLERLKLRVAEMYELLQTFLNKAFILQNARVTHLEERIEPTKCTNETLNKLNGALTELNKSLRITDDRIKKLEQAVFPEKPAPTFS